jgi:endogenous inhibitor of DNA gyrase (YacG/DUF329 family)
MRCPICRKPVDRENPEFPFCSDRCRLIDLGKWSSEEYVISTPLRPEDVAKEQERAPSEDDER